MVNSDVMVYSTELDHVLHRGPMLPCFEIYSLVCSVADEAKGAFSTFLFFASLFNARLQLECRAVTVVLQWLVRCYNVIKVMLGVEQWRV